MKLYSENKEYKLYEGSMLDMLEAIEPNSIDSIITDPPYELNFMNNGWDNSGIAFQKDAWKKCYDVLKPGGYLLAFGGSRTFHRIACAIEDAGLEIRDTIMWLYGSGFPKSMNIGLALDKKMGVESIDTGIQSPNARPNSNKSNTLYESGTVGKEFTIKKATNEWDGWGTCLKPAYEPIIVARKPVENSIIDNVVKYGVGGINIDECRVENTQADSYDLEKRGISKATGSDNDGHFLDGLHNKDLKHGVVENGRFPTNVILTYDETDFEEVCGGMPTSDRPNENITKEYKINNQVYREYGNCHTWDAYQDSENASRYFYCAKASKFDRDEGLEYFEDKNISDGRKAKSDRPYLRKETPRKNIHPTVKPTELMRYLVRLVSPKGTTILDCFNGSGSTGKAVMLENKEFKKDYKYIGIELTEEYLPIAKARIEYICNNDFVFTESDNCVSEHKIVEKGYKNTSIFDFGVEINN